MVRILKIETLIAGAIVGVGGVLAYQYLLPCKGIMDANKLGAVSGDDIIGYFNGLKRASPEDYLLNIRLWRDYWLREKPEMMKCIAEWYTYAKALA